MKIWRCERTPVAQKIPAFLVSSNLCQEIVQPDHSPKLSIDTTYARFLSEPGWLIGVLWRADYELSVRDELENWLTNEVSGRYEILKFSQFSFYESFELKLRNDEDMALFKLRFGEYFDIFKLD